jgi:hypothetical protein
MAPLAREADESTDGVVTRVSRQAAAARARAGDHSPFSPSTSRTQPWRMALAIADEVAPRLVAVATVWPAHAISISNCAKRPVPSRRGFLSTSSSTRRESALPGEAGGAAESAAADAGSLAGSLAGLAFAAVLIGRCLSPSAGLTSMAGIFS